MELSNILIVLIIGFTSTYGIYIAINTFYKNTFKSLNIDEQFILELFNIFICLLWTILIFWYFLIIK